MTLDSHDKAIYLDWLIGQLGLNWGEKSQQFCSMAEFLFYIPFRWKSIAPGDENRAIDGVELREEYFGKRESDAEPAECTVLEAIAGICRRMIFMSGGMLDGSMDTERDWFDEIISNLGIFHFNDARWDENPTEAEAFVSQAVDKWLDRDYDPDGFGGAFPLRKPSRDQTKVELWYQMNAYLSEKIG